MKKFRVVFLPHGREDKEWMDVDAISAEEAQTNFKAGLVISVRELKEEDND